MTQYKLTQDEEGAGKFRGGSAVYLEMVADTKLGELAFLMTGNSDGQIVAATGPVSGPIAKAGMWIRKTDGKNRPLRTMANEPIAHGEVCCTKGLGCGGWGDPLDRDVGKVCNDIIDGYISITRAKDVHGVILDPDTLEIQMETNENLRRELRNSNSKE